VGDVHETASAHPIAALLVLLDLLKRQAEPIRQPFLTHAQHYAAHSHAVPDVLVDWTGGFTAAIFPR
jgi:hypothetical protein